MGDHGLTTMWRYAHACSTGASHLKRNEPCQDRVRCGGVGSTVIVAIADGAGSAPRGGEGADAAVAAALACLEKSVSQNEPNWVAEIETAATAARGAIERAAASEGRPVRDFACTLLLLAAGAKGGAALQIGDGVIAVRRNDDEAWAWVIWPQKGEYANTTRFLIDPDAPSAWETAEIGSDVVDFAMMTDGLEGLALNFAARSAHDNFFEGLLAPLRGSAAQGLDALLSSGLTEFLASPRVTARADDDLTLVIATRRGEGA
jgi:hypothetical protein